MNRSEPIAEIARPQFPALSRTWQGSRLIYFDGPAGTQVPRRVADAMHDYLLTKNANHGGVFVTSRESDALLSAAHTAFAEFLGTDDPGTICFGPNMTTMTLALSRALARTWRTGDEVIVTQMDHDANVHPWMLAARDVGAVVRVVPLRCEDCTLDLDTLQKYLSSRTRLVAVACASNAVGTINPVRQICQWAKQVGALTFLDAVHYVPHRLPEVTQWDCDFLVCSAYKFFGPHLGILWGRRELLEALPAYKVRPAPDTLPDKWMTGTQSHEAVVGALAALEYLADLGRRVSGCNDLPRRQAWQAAYSSMAQHEADLTRSLLLQLADFPQFRVWGIQDLNRMDERVSTVAVTHKTKTSKELAEFLALHGICAWHGNYYALNLTTALGVEPHGMLRIGLVHYNIHEEIDRLANVLALVVTRT